MGHSTTHSKAFECFNKTLNSIVEVINFVFDESVNHDNNFDEVPPQRFEQISNIEKDDDVE